MRGQKSARGAGSLSALRRWGAFFVLALLIAGCGATGGGLGLTNNVAPTPSDTLPPLLLIHPPFAETYACAEHWEGEHKKRGDALGTDCFVIGQVPTPTGGVILSPFKNRGFENSDWFTYRAAILAPVAGTVARVVRRTEPNQPGIIGAAPATYVEIVDRDGVHIVVAHIEAITVASGDEVTAGQVIGRVGNNGLSRAPHIHIGAWKGRTAYQLRHDQQAMLGGRGQD
ncbi:hypothetical protein PB2503_00887 [Parvularcula bermudensis HTCC2503]|uniref:M23ase beta-sheet core domain-containing protein n=1 Tax=Parvularcula bermudensis (strain ATCC BAA-594 / HTCC2503 / KCTC 12087) TaxID=314260 RepID=E0TB49_PARBH|nr:peptidoglycan DD-metalloendopeptidase family protein [Parvularcula bermudensis]ADM08258.1 hypothetical protein PB2503_00887 [Parvularcula bermudensis HTCC2503]